LIDGIGPQLRPIGVKIEVTMAGMHPLLALGVFVSTAATDAVYVLFNAAVSSRRRIPAATWSSVWYLLSAFAVISYTKNWLYVLFAASGSWVGAYISMTLLDRPKAGGTGLGRGPVS
jgi:hypothetical protein